MTRERPLKLSVVTISYNQVTWLPALLQCVSELRDHVEVEHIVVDPGSTDGSRDLLIAAAAAVDSLILEPDLGPADGLNKGFDAATGDVFCYINADDFLIPAGVPKVMHAFSRRPAPDIVLADGRLVDGDGALIRRFRTARRPTVRALALGTAVVLQQGSFFWRNSLPVKPFNEHNRIAWDTELVLSQLSRGAMVHCVHAEVGAFRIHADGLTGSGAHQAAVRSEHKRMFEQFVGAPWGRRTDVEYWVRRGSKGALAALLEPSRIAHKTVGRGPRSWR
jgi:glycosyltransferase involved in cell wall biosynthesis